MAESALHDFGQVVQGKEVEHRFVLRNGGLEDLVLEESAVADHLELGGFDRVVPPGGSVEIPVLLDTAGLFGSGELQVTFTTNDPESPELSLAVQGEIVQLVEVEPGSRVYFLDLTRGATAEKQVRLINHQQAPLEILAVTSGEPRYFDTQLETVTEGQAYLLKVRTALPDAVGTFEETISISTDSPELPTIPLRAVARVRERVHADPAAVSFARFYFEDIESAVLATKKVRVRKAGGKDFALLDVSSDVPALDLEVTVENPGESYLVLVRIDPARARRGPLEGTLRIATNDPDFPELRLPISGEIL